MNKPKSYKQKFTYFEHKKVFATLGLIAKDETSIRGRIVRVPELIRSMTKARANDYRRKQGQSQIDYDPSSGKFAPSEADAAVLAHVYTNGHLDVFNKRGKKMNGWKNVSQLPELLRLYPKCKVRSCPSHHNDSVNGFCNRASDQQARRNAVKQL